MPQLPQELIELILDEVASQKSQKEWMNTLVSCSFVSRSFYAAARRNLFADIDFKLDKNLRNRARRLHKILLKHTSSSGTQAKDANIVPAIRSLRLYFDLPSLHPPKVLGVHWLGGIRSILRYTDRWRKRDNLAAVLEVVKRAPLEELTIEVAQVGQRWTGSLSAGGPIGALCFMPSIHILRLVNIQQVDPRILSRRDTSCKIKELVLSDVAFSEDVAGSNTPDPSILCREIEKLELYNVQVTQVLRVLGVAPTQAGLESQRSRFQHLKELTVSPPPHEDDQHSLRLFMVSIRQSLRCLRFKRNYKASLPSPNT